MANISIYGSHNSAIVVENNGEILCVVETERFCGYKNSGLAQYKVPHNGELILQQIMSWIKKTYGLTHFSTCYYGNTDVVHDNVMWRLEKFISADKYEHITHHMAHANGTFYQSPFDKALIFSFDGGGDDGKFNIYYANREEGAQLVTKIKNPTLDTDHIQYDLGFPYMVIGHYLKDIKFEPLGDGNLVYPGKIMGLVSYGKVREEWLPHFIHFYKSDPNGNNYEPLVHELGNNIGVEFNTANRLEGQLAYDIAATSQRAFEDCFLEYAIPYMNALPDLPVCITGGCGLNILLNTRLVNEFKKRVFVGPNPNDCGIALGMMLTVLKPKEPFDATYAGLPVLDMASLSNYVVDFPHVRQLTVHAAKYPKKVEIKFDCFVDDLINGKIVGVVRGNSEHGPRALGNRSILCNPAFPEMKDVLNKKVKNREWYRPFAPVVRLEDVNKYFEWNQDARWMSFAPVVREKWRDKLSSITHVDNTARVQTVTREQNPWLYSLLTLIERKTGVGVLLNTSFNVNGKPILTTLKDAFHVFNHSQMDALLIENYYFRKEPFQDNLYEDILIYE